jgi:hypothetical protein
MASIDISARIIGDTELAQTLARLSSHDIPKAIKAGVRLASRGAKTALGKNISAITPIPSARIKDDVFVSIAGDGQSAQVYTSSQPISALRFKPKQTRTGLQLTLYKGERTVIRSGFMQTNRDQAGRGKLPFKPTSERPYIYDGRRKTKRKGMQFVFGLSIASIYLGGRHSARLQQLTEARVEEQLVKGILQRLGAMGRGFGKA